MFFSSASHEKLMLITYLLSRMMLSIFMDIHDKMASPYDEVQVTHTNRTTHTTLPQRTLPRLRKWFMVGIVFSPGPNKARRWGRVLLVHVESFLNLLRWVVSALAEKWLHWFWITVAAGESTGVDLCAMWSSLFKLFMGVLFGRAGRSAPGKHFGIIDQLVVGFCWENYACIIVHVLKLQILLKFKLYV